MQSGSWLVLIISSQVLYHFATAAGLNCHFLWLWVADDMLGSRNPLTHHQKLSALQLVHCCLTKLSKLFSLFSWSQAAAGLIGTPDIAISSWVLCHCAAHAGLIWSDQTFLHHFFTKPSGRWFDSKPLHHHPKLSALPLCCSCWSNLIWASLTSIIFSCVKRGLVWVHPGSTKGGSITVLLTSCLTGLD